MTDKPIIFSAPMVRALLDGRKSMARRVLNPQPEVGPLSSEHLEDHELRGWHDLTCGDEWATVKRLPYAPGDRLWVREACKPIPASKPGGYFVPGSPFYGVEWFYRADGNCPLWADGKWRPSIHMPRWASRLTLTVTGVRVQRLQEISEQDAVAEGITAVTHHFPPLQGCPEQLRHRTIYEWPGGWSVRAADAYAVLWRSLHGPDAWSANPWVVAVSFTVEQRNIDA